MAFGDEPREPRPRSPWAPPPWPNDPYGASDPAQNDARAVLSLVLGILSLVTCGLTGIPAVALGFTARGAIQRSGGMLRGAGLATGGIATGLAGTAMAMIGVTLLLAGMLVTSRHASRPAYAPPPRATTAWSPAAPSVPAGPTTIGSIRVLDLDPDAKRTFHQQLADEYGRATTSHQTVLVMTSARWCSVCKEFEASLADPRMQAALANVALVRVDIDDFDDELKAGGMLEETLPWFYKVDASLHPVDAISAGEWDENVPENMAPVMKSFLAGKLRTRRDPSMGTSL